MVWHAGCLLTVMMPTMIEKIEYSHPPHHTPEQARQLLEELRAAYQSLPMGDRSVFKNAISQMGRDQFAQEQAEQEWQCFA